MSDKLQEIKDDFEWGIKAAGQGQGYTNLDDEQVSWLIEQLEQARQKNHNMWECPVCGFAFDAIHTDDKTGEYSCPACAELELERKLAQAQRRVELIESFKRQYREKAISKASEVRQLRVENQKLVEQLKTIKTYTRSTFQNEGNKILRIEEVATEALSEVEGNEATNSKSQT